MSKITFDSHGYKLAGNIFLPQGKAQRLAFLIIQGWQGHQNVEAAQALASLGYPAMTYDMRGNGNSEGNFAEFTRADFAKDAAVAYDYLSEQVGGDMPIGVAGSSFGSYTAVLLTKERNVFCLSLRVPASYPSEGFDKPQLPQADPDVLMDWRKKKLDYTQNDALTILHNFKGKVQIIEAEKDEVVPPQSPKNYADAVDDKTQLTYEIVPGAPHRVSSPQLQADYEKRLIAWVKTLNP